MTANLIQAYPFDYSISSFYSPSHNSFGALSREGKRFLPIELQFKRGKVNDFSNVRIRANDCRSIMTADCLNYIKDYTNILKIVRRSPIWATPDPLGQEKRQNSEDNEKSVWRRRCKECGQAMALNHRNENADHTSQDGPKIVQMKKEDQATEAREQQNDVVWSRIRVLKKDSASPPKDSSFPKQTVRNIRANSWRRIRVMKRM